MASKDKEQFSELVTPIEDRLVNPKRRAPELKDNSPFKLDPGIGFERHGINIMLALQNAKTAQFGDKNSIQNQKLREVLEKAEDEPVEVERMTEEEKSSLRAASKKEIPLIGVVLRASNKLVRSVQSALGTSGASQVSRSYQCEQYGHQLPAAGAWSGSFPKCERCGAEITSLDQTRRPTKSE